jgi:bifunctional non-homologous end joining protein LigD
MFRRSDTIDPATLSGSVEATAPKRLSPQLLTLSKVVPGGDNWLHEIKHDGFRMTVSISEGRTRLWTRNGFDWTARLPSLVKPLEDLGLSAAAFDAEMVCLDEEGRTDFARLHRCATRIGRGRPLLYLFDLVHINGWDLGRASLLDRKKLLRRILDESTDTETSVLRFSDHLIGSGRMVYEQACRLGLEGIVSKRVDSSYLAGRRSRSWLKIKNPQYHRDTAVSWRNG